MSTSDAGTSGVTQGVMVFAEAKINLRLRILAREASGFHTIETIFHKLELADTVELRLQPPTVRQLDCDGDVGPPEHNLAIRAAEAFLARSAWETGYTIRIRKQIPIGGGLGGGSADAGATLRALNALAPAPLAPETLLELAATLGADVPFLTADATMALAWGRGDRFLALDPLPTRAVVLITPGFGVPTVDAYGWLAAERQTDATSSSVAQASPRMMHPWHLANWGELGRWMVNDFTPVVARHHSTVAPLITALHDAGASNAGMSGSGSTLFGIFERAPDVSALRARVDELSNGRGNVIVTRTAVGVSAVRGMD